jgi:hypothetical protein
VPIDSLFHSIAPRPRFGTGKCLLQNGRLGCPAVVKSSASARWSAAPDAPMLLELDRILRQHSTVRHYVLHGGVLAPPSAVRPPTSVYVPAGRAGIAVINYMYVRIVKLPSRK